jgi:hypothetical protein
MDSAPRSSACAKYMYVHVRLLAEERLKRNRRMCLLLRAVLVLLQAYAKRSRLDPLLVSVTLLSLSFPLSSI